MEAPQRTSRPFDVGLRTVFAIALPMTLAHVSTPLVGITDTAVIGQLGSAALIGAAALGAVLFDLLGTTFNFLRIGTTGLVAQALGAEDHAAQAMTLWRALLLAMAAGALIVALHGPILALFLGATGASDAVADATSDYFGMRVWGMPFMLANYAILGWLLGLGRALTGLALQLLLALVNIAASIAFVLGLGWGVVGVAAASVLAEGVALCAGAAIVAATFRGSRRPELAAIFERVAFRRMLGINADILIRSLILMGSFTFFTAMGARLGDVTLAANAILMNVFLLSAYVLDGMATAAEQLGGKAVGARYRPAFDRTVRLTLVASLVISAALTLMWLAAGPYYAALMTTAEAVRSETLHYLPWAAATPLVGAVAFVMDGLYIGATWTATMRNMMIASAALFVLVWWLATPVLGNHGLWLALLTFLGVRGVTLWARVPALARRAFPANAGQVAQTPRAA